MTNKIDKNPEKKILTDKIKNSLMEITGRYWKVEDLSSPFHENYNIELSTLKSDGDKFDGMQMLYEDGIYEVSEYQCGPEKDQLWIYKETPYLKVAIRYFMKGNNQKPIKIW